MKQTTNHKWETIGKGNKHIYVKCESKYLRELADTDVYVKI
jgi:hypothetical protein